MHFYQPSLWGRGHDKARQNGAFAECPGTNRSDTRDHSRMIDPLKGIDGAMPKDLFPWHFNVCRQRIRGTTIERTAFSPTGKDDFYVLEKFAKLWGKGK